VNQEARNRTGCLYGSFERSDSSLSDTRGTGWIDCYQDISSKNWGWRWAEIEELTYDMRMWIRLRETWVFRSTEHKDTYSYDLEATGGIGVLAFAQEDILSGSIDNTRQACQLFPPSLTCHCYSRKSCMTLWSPRRCIAGIYRHLEAWGADGRLLDTCWRLLGVESFGTRVLIRW